jgi:hypothetical protein
MPDRLIELGLERDESDQGHDAPRFKADDGRPRRSHCGLGEGVATTRRQSLMRANSIFRTAALSLALLVYASVGHATTVSFDEFPPANDSSLLSEQYADLGIHFVPDDDGSVWAGLSGGDPGRWGLEGTNGTAFVGFNGPSFALSALFDAPVENVALDVSAAKGSSLGDTFTLVGFVEGELVEEVTVTLGGPNVWQTVALMEMVDEIQLFGAGEGFHPYGVDNFTWSSAASDPSEEEPPEVASVEIDLKPWSRWSSRWMRRWAPVFVVLYGSESFDVESVDPGSLELGPNGAPASHHVLYWDINRDGQIDLISRFRAADSGISATDQEACLTGATFDGLRFEGCDVREVNPWKRDQHRHSRHDR